MRIPVYRAQGQLASTMPGRQIRARKSVSAAQQAEMAKATPGMALTDAIGEYAQTRYKMQVENDLNSAMLDAQEALRERRRELAKDPNYNKVLDGDDPIWDKETAQLQQQLRAKVGKDRYALQQFESRFRQLEQQNRFALRDSIDRRVEVAAAQNRARKLSNAEKAIAEGTDLSQVSFIFRDIIQDTKKLAEIKAGNLDVLTAQQKEMLVRAVYGALEKNADEADSGVAFIEEIRLALRDGVSPDTLDPRGEGKSSLTSQQAAYVYGLMKMLDPADQAKILRSVGGTQSFLEGPSLAEQQAQLLAESYSDSYSENIGVRMDQITLGNVQSDDQLAELGRNIQSILPNLPPAKAAQLQSDYNDLQQLNSVQRGLGRQANLSNIDGYIKQYENGLSGRGGAGVDTKFEQNALALVTKYKQNMMAAMAPDGDAIDFVQRTKMDGVRISPVDLTLEGVMNDAAMSAREGGPSMLELRIQQGQTIKALNGLNYTPVLSKAESQAVLDVVTENGVDGAVYLKTLTSMMEGKDAAILLENMRRAGLPSEYIQAMYVGDGDPIAIKKLVDIVGRSEEDLKVGLSSAVTSGEGGIPKSMNNSKELQDYRAAYLAGGSGAAAEKLFNEQYEMAKRLAYSYAKDDGMSGSEAAKAAISVVFKGVPTTENRQLYITPEKFDSKAVGEGALALMDPEILRRFDIISLDDPKYGFAENIGINVKSLSSTGIWLNNATGDGLMLHYNLNGTYIPVELGDGQYLDVSFDILSKLTASDLSQFEGEGLTPSTLKRIKYGPRSGLEIDFPGDTSPVGSEFPGLDPSLMQGGNQ